VQVDLGGGGAAVAQPVADLHDGDPVGGFVGLDVAGRAREVPGVAHRRVCAGLEYRGGVRRQQHDKGAAGPRDGAAPQPRAQRRPVRT